MCGGMFEVRNDNRCEITKNEITKKNTILKSLWPHAKPQNKKRNLKQKKSRYSISFRALNGFPVMKLYRTKVRKKILFQPKSLQNLLWNGDRVFYTNLFSIFYYSVYWTKNKYIHTQHTNYSTDARRCKNCIGKQPK